MNLRLFSIAFVFAFGAGIARLVAAAHGPRVSPDFAQPLVVVTAWGPYGETCFALLAATIGCAALALFAIVRDSRPAALVPAGSIALAAAAAVAAAYAWPFVFSSDPYAYAAYGWLAAHGVDPYRPVPPGLHGAFVDAARFQWSGAFPVCIYGPAFVALAEGIVRLEGSAGNDPTLADVGAALWCLRFVAAAAFLGSIFALDAGLRGLSSRRRFLTVALFGLNPVALWSVAEGHNDALVLLALCGGFALVRRGRSESGALLLGLMALLKATGLAFALGFALDAWALAVPRARRLVVGIATGVVVSVVFALPPLLPALAAARTAGHGPISSAPPGTSPREVIGFMPALVLAVAAAAYGALRLRARARDGHAWLGIAAWLVVPNTYPWYCLWFLPAVAAAGGGAAAWALYGVTISGIVRYLPDAVGRLEPNALRLAAAVAAAPLVLALAALRRAPTLRKTTPP